MTQDKHIHAIQMQEGGIDDLYLNCTFGGCDFSELTLDQIHFEACVFESCNFSMTKLFCQLNDVQFVACKVVGADFSGLVSCANALQFIKSNLSYASFSDTKLPVSRFVDCALVECDFSGCDLSGSVFDRCDLSRSIFAQTNLERVDLATSYSLTINPTINRVRKMVVAQSELHSLVAHLGVVVQ